MSNRLSAVVGYIAVHVLYSLISDWYLANFVCCYKKRQNSVTISMYVVGCCQIISESTALSR